MAELGEKGTLADTRGSLLGRLLVWGLAVVLLLIGGSLLVGGVILIGSGGSVYYLFASIAVLTAVAGLVLGLRLAIVSYGVLLAATVPWALWEAGLSAWALAPRLVAPCVLGLLFLTPPVWRASQRASRWWVGAPILAAGAAMVLAAIVESRQFSSLDPAVVLESDDSSAAEWREWGGTLAGQRYSGLADIRATNVKHLKPVWEYVSDVPVHGGAGHSFEATPLAVGRQLYLCLDRNVIVSLDQETGREIWRYDPETNLEGIYSATCRGVTYHGEPEEGAECSSRILFGTQDGRLMAVDARNGRPCSEFGNGGTVKLLEGLGDVPPGTAYPTSPPVVVNDVAIIGGWVTDGLALNEPSGVVRGFDVRSGELLWAWDAVRPDSSSPLAEGETFARGSPNAWGVFSGDEELGLVYVPTGSATPDYFGAHRRPEFEKYGSAIVALDASTGNVRWAFQTVHHDLWDYDIASQPVLVDLEEGGKPVPALIATTKRGQLFVLDRRSGRPIDEVVERKVPQGTVAEEWLSPTQPYTTGFPSVAGPDLRERDMWGLTPLDQLWCRIRFKQARYEGQFTPPSLQPTIGYPGSAGGSNWGSATVDPLRQLLVVNTLHAADYARLVPREEANRMKAEAAAQATEDSAVPEALRAGEGAEFAYFQPQEGTPYAFWRSIFISPLETLCQEPPYARLSVFDIKTRQLLWSHPFGTIAHSGPFGIETGLPIRMGVPTIGGSLATAGGLLFIGASQDRRFRAYDIASGKQLWSHTLPTSAGATPMTYRSPVSGRQFVVIAAGGHPALGGPPGGHLIAFALPED